MVKYVNVKTGIGIALGASVLIWCMVLIITGTKFVLNWVAFKHLPTVFSIDMFLFWVFTRWGWKWKRLQGWLVPFPNLNGVWTGKIQSLWKGTDKKEEFNITLTIKQTFLSVHCGIKTVESESESYSAAFIVNSETGKKRLVYNYYNKPRASVRDRSIPHDGTALLNITTDGVNIRLEGEYWTSRQSSGEVVFEFRRHNT